MTWTRALTLGLLLSATAACDTEEFADAGPDPGPDPGETSAPPQAGVTGDVILRNRVALDMPVLIRLLPDDAAIDCDAVAMDPGASLPASRFDAGDVVTLSPHEMVAVAPHEPGERPCYAAWVETEGLGARVLFWRDGEPPITTYPLSCCDVGMGVVELIPVDGGWSLDLLGNTWLVFEPEA